MKSLLVINIEREMNKGQKTFTDKTIRLLIATIEAQDKQIDGLKQRVAEAEARRLVDAE